MTRQPGSGLILALALAGCQAPYPGLLARPAGSAAALAFPSPGAIGPMATAALALTQTSHLRYYQSPFYGSELIPDESTYVETSDYFALATGADAGSDGATGDLQFAYSTDYWFDPAQTLLAGTRKVVSDSATLSPTVRFLPLAEGASSSDPAPAAGWDQALVADASGDAPLQPGDTYYFAFLRPGASGPNYGELSIPSCLGDARTLVLEYRYQATPGRMVWN